MSPAIVILPRLIIDGTLPMHPTPLSVTIVAASIAL
jgi:hypothetical protein